MKKEYDFSKGVRGKFYNADAGMIVVVPEFIPIPLEGNRPGQVSPTIREGIKKFSVADYNYQPTIFTERQENFYQNLLRLYRLTKGSKRLPAYFIGQDESKWYMDRGCVKMAVHDGFLDELRDEPVTGKVTYVTLSWVKDKT